MNISIYLTSKEQTEQENNHTCFVFHLRWGNLPNDLELQQVFIILDRVT